MPPNASVSPATSRDPGLVEPGVARVCTKLAGATCGSGPLAIDAFIDNRDENAGAPKDANAPGEMAGAATVAAASSAVMMGALTTRSKPWLSASRCRPAADSLKTPDSRAK